MNVKKLLRYPVKIVVKQQNHINIFITKTELS